MATINEEVKVAINAEDNASKVMGKVEDSVSSLKKGLGALAAAFTAAKVMDFVNDSIAAYEESVRVSAALEIAAKNADNLGKGYAKTAEGVSLAVDELTKYAETLQSTTAFEDDAIIAAESVLVQFGAGVDQVKLLTPAMLDYASSIELTTGQQVNLTDVAQMMGKTFDGSSGILEKFKIQLTDSQKAAFEHATSLERMGMVATLVEQQYSGSTERLSATTQGELKKAEIAWGNFKEQIGAQITPIKAKLAEYTLWLITNFQEGWKIVITAWEGFWVDFFMKYDAAKQSLSDSWNGFWSYLGGVVDSVVQGINQTIRGMIDLAQKAIDTLLEVASLSFADTKTYNTKARPTANIPATLSAPKRRAKGGLVSAGENYTVGEQGIEMFSPKTDGFIMPNQMMGGKSIILNFSFNGPVSSKQVAEEYADYVVDKLKLITKVV